MEKNANVNLNEILDRFCVKSDLKPSLYLANISLMGSAPTVVVFDSIDAIDYLIRNNPGISVSLITVPHYV